MSRTFHGICRNGRIELTESKQAQDGPVLITFLDAGEIDLKARGISEQQAASLRGRLTSFAEDWESPEMLAYDNYDASRSSKY